MEHSPELPPRPFLYTLDQIAALLSLTLRYTRDNYIYYDGRSIGIKRPDLMLARNIAPPQVPTPDWRVSERELARFLKHKGFRIHTRGWIE